MVTVLYTHRVNQERSQGEGGSAAGRGKRTSGLTKDGTTNSVGILAHAWPLPQLTPDTPAVQVLVAGSARRSPEAKHSSWLRDRGRLDQLKSEVNARGRCFVHRRLLRRFFHTVLWSPILMMLQVPADAHCCAVTVLSE